MVSKRALLLALLLPLWAKAFYIESLHFHNSSYSSAHTVGYHTNHSQINYSYFNASHYAWYAYAHNFEHALDTIDITTLVGAGTQIDKTIEPMATVGIDFEPIFWPIVSIRYALTPTVSFTRAYFQQTVPIPSAAIDMRVIFGAQSLRQNSQNITALAWGVNVLF